MQIRDSVGNDYVKRDKKWFQVPVLDVKAKLHFTALMG